MAAPSGSTVALGALVADQYRVVRAMAAGGFGTVYEAIRISDAVPVALKLLHAKLGADTVTLERFRREAALVCRLDHPSIVKLLDFGTTADGTPYIAFELLRGRALRDDIRRGGPLTAGRAGAITADVLRALAHAHALGLVHRDIKPANVFLCGAAPAIDAVKLLDFGIAKALHGDFGAHAKLTATGEMIGTPQYMAPEQVRGAPVGPATDLYAVGLLLAEMLTGKAAVRAASSVDVLVAQMAREPHRLAPEITASPLGAVVERAVRKPPQERYASAEQMLQELARALRQPAETPFATLAATAVTEATRPLVAGVATTVAAGPAPTPSAAPVAQAAGYAPPPVAARRDARAIPWLAVGLGALAASLLGAVGLIGWLVAAQGADGRAAATPSSGTSAPAEVTSAAAAREPSEVLEVANLGRVDAQAIVAQATRLAQRLEPTARLACLMPMRVEGQLTGGLIDLRPTPGDGAVFLSFRHELPPGAASGYGVLLVTARAAKLSVKRESPPYPFCGPLSGPVPAPLCPVVTAWGVVVGAGVPAAERPSLELARNEQNDGAPPVWRFTVASHPEYSSSVDSRTCGLVQAPKVVWPRAPSAAPTRTRPGDLQFD